MRLSEDRSFWDLTVASGFSPRRFIADDQCKISLRDLAAPGSAEGNAGLFRGRSVLISCSRQLPGVMALFSLDGLARRILLCPPDLSPAHLPAVISEAEVELIVCDGTGPAAGLVNDIPMVNIVSPIPVADRRHATEWLLFTSGTTGQPKMVVHSRESLIGPLDDGLAVGSDAVWSTFYDVRRYGGLTILFRALLGGASMVLSQAGEPVGLFLNRAGQFGVTHISGTPSHWRRALMATAKGEFAPNYIRMSGEVADQPILNSLAHAFPNANVAHAFASTEAGFAFDVRDGLAGFPATLIGPTGGKSEMRIEEGSLRIRSARTASRYLGGGGPLVDPDGFVDTGDMVALRGDRYYFVGRREGVINVGGLKVHPEEVETVIMQHPAVRMARVRGRPSPITGAIVVADVVLQAAGPTLSEVSDEIIAACREALPPYKVPAMLNDVSSLEIAESGKLMRRIA